MFLELIAVIFAGIAAAGVVMLLNRTLKGRLPRWMAPVAAGLAMIGVTIASEYGWYGRTKAALPEGLEVAETVEKQSFYRPWTYAVPYVDRFAAIDTATMKSHEAHPQVYLAEVYFFGRWAPVSRRPAVLDCGKWRRALVASNVVFSGNSLPKGLDWIAGGPDDALLTTACGG
ncbi:hypothetical protein K3722_07315 [Leisingera caerulea]|uniref:Uncharacterized protein n=1 Tax=Leisingera caerulea TaxID=506591 RepID=A0ABY5X013_LEICA|nr:hypothetical protein [Leisingera caerulea]UWQ59931.1 hypothetical protein K3722_07315 [Leisingera caerulea]UWQ84984.1 hypothetical protein K3726_07215 [Leisingera caerulea]